MAATAQQILDAANDAILAIIQGGAQSYTLIIDETQRQVTKLDLTELRTMRDEARKEINLTTVGIRRNFAVPRRASF